MASTVSPQNKKAPSGSNPGTPDSPESPALKSFSITHIRKSQPTQVLVDIIAALNETDAVQRAGERFPDSTVLRICRARAEQDAQLAQKQDQKQDRAEGEKQAHPSSASGNNEPPNARFIRGRFRLAGSEDEPILRTICE